MITYAVVLFISAAISYFLGSYFKNKEWQSRINEWSGE